jgi:hypothetical protein
MREPGTLARQAVRVATFIDAKTCCALLQHGGLALDSAALKTLAQIALAESRGQVDLTIGNRYGVWQLDASLGFDRARMLRDAMYAATWALKASDSGRQLQIFPSWRSKGYATYLNQVQQGAAQAAALVGSVLINGQFVPAPFYDTASNSYVAGSDPSQASYPVLAGAGSPLVSAQERLGPLLGLRVSGTEVTGDFGSSIIGMPHYEAGFGTMPNLSFTIADPEGDLLWLQGNLWQQGATVSYLDLDLRIDTIEFSPGPATTGQLDISAVDAIVYALQRLRGARTAANISVANWLRQEMNFAGYDAGRFLLAENGPSQATIARDVPDQAGAGSGGEIPSAWTTAVRLAKETGKRLFVSGRKLIYGSAEFAMQWAAAGDLTVGYHNVTEGQRWLSLPTAKQTSVGDRDNVTEVTGRVPFNRAQYFRPGVSVIVTRTPAVAAGPRTLVCSNVSYDLGRDIDGAEITLIEPVNLAVEKK